MENDADILLNIGFVDVGHWKRAQADRTIMYNLDGVNIERNKARFEVQNALYAFVHNGHVRYIGKTSRSIARRFVGYCNGAGQATNRRCNEHIQEILDQHGEVRIFIFAPAHNFRWGDFEVNLAAGLEDALIRQISPPWNVAGGNPRPITEDAEREAAANPSPERPQPVQQHGVPFKIVLGPTYYRHGFINPGVIASQQLGEHGDPVVVYLGDRGNVVESQINRTANSNGSVRLIGNNGQIARWFQANFNLGATVTAEVLDHNHILIQGPVVQQDS